MKGVIELGGLSEFSDDVLGFLESTADSIAIGINSAQNRIQIRQALETTTEQANTLQIQQQKLSLANDELKNKTTVLEEQKKQVEAANEELEITRLEIQAKADDLAQASKYKSEFLANMSHELRTPLNSLLILASSLSKNKGGNMTPEQVEKSSVIHSAGADLLRLINDILDLSKVESGMLDIQPEDVLIQDILDHIERNFEPVGREQGVALVFELSPSAPVSIYTDEVRVEQILGNLASNAFKFTDSGTVTVRVASAPNDMISFSVADTGIGIASDHQRSIFEAFQQADGSIGRRFGGTGLGLSISRNLAELLGGAIELESQFGEGSTFTLRLPIGENPDGSQAAPSRGKSGSTGPSSNRAAVDTQKRQGGGAAADVDLASSSTRASTHDRPSIANNELTVLIIDDDPRFQNILIEVAHERGLKTLVAGDGRSGLAMAKEHVPDFIILDIQLPHLDGLRVLDALKEDPITRNVPVSVISVADEERSSLEKGAISYLSKPVSSEAIALTFEGFQSRRAVASGQDQTTGAAQQSDGARPDLANLLEDTKILVVDDDMRNTFALGAGLEEMGGTVVIAGNGRLALDALEQEDDFDVVIMDIMMPVMNGFEAMLEIRCMEQYREIPIVALTAMSSPENEENCIASGANAYMTKPVDLDELAVQIKDLLEPPSDLVESA